MTDNSRATPPRAPTPSATADDGHIAAVLRAFAALTGSGDRPSNDVTTGGQPLVWLGLDSALTEQWQQSDPMIDSAPVAWRGRRAVRSPTPPPHGRAPAAS